MVDDKEDLRPLFSVVGDGLQVTLSSNAVVEACQMVGKDGVKGIGFRFDYLGHVSEIALSDEAFNACMYMYTMFKEHKDLITELKEEIGESLQDNDH